MFYDADCKLEILNIGVLNFAALLLNEKMNLYFNPEIYFTFFAAVKICGL